jgi:hypothetical protein
MNRLIQPGVTGEDARALLMMHAQIRRASQKEALHFPEIPLPNLGFRCFLLGVLAAEALHAAGRIHELLLARKEGMATGANFYVDIALVGRARGKAVATRAHDPDFVVAGMNSCFHGVLTSVPNHSILKDGRRIQQMEPAGRVSRKSEEVQ